MVLLVRCLGRFALVGVSLYSLWTHEVENLFRLFIDRRKIFLGEFVILGLLEAMGL